MNNNFEYLAQRFILRHLKEIQDHEWDDTELDDEIRQFVNNQGIDPAWEDELFELIRDSVAEARDL